MDPNIALMIVGTVFLGLIAFGCPIAFALAGSGALGIFLLRGPDMVTATLQSAPFEATSSYSLAIIPMYVLLGMFALHGRLAERAYAVARAAFARLPGGLGVATVVACAGFAAVSGSSVATAATIGKVSIGEMRRYGYPAAFAAGTVAAAGTLGVLIPPSIVLVMFGVVSRTSIAALLAAGIIPGLLTAAAYIGYIVWHFTRHPVDVPGTLGQALTDGTDRDPGGAAVSVVSKIPNSDGVLPGTEPGSLGGGTLLSAPVSSRELIRKNWVAIPWLAAIFAVVIVGIYSGLFTVIESGAVAALLALLMLVTQRGMGIRNLARSIREALLETSSVISMALAILVGATIFTAFLVMTRAPVKLSTWITGLGLSKYLILIIVLLVLLLLGTVLETLSIIVITVPLLAPVISGLGFDMVWFGILFVKMIEIGLVTPPVGMNAFVVSGASGVPIEKTFRGVVPFIVVELLIVAVLVLFPDLVLWLPSVVDG